VEAFVVNWPWERKTEAAPKGPSRPAAGERYEGPVTYTTDPLIGRAGYYALDDVKTDKGGENLHQIKEPHVMLTWVDEAPGDDEDGSGHFIVADPDKPYFVQLPPHLDENLVPIESDVQATSGVRIGG
jgi:hypothetical protein